LALYFDGEGHIECSVEVEQPFAGNERVVCSSTPAGMVATTVHLGPYDRLGEAHAAIRQWYAAQGHGLTAMCWEMYRHWHDDPSPLRSDVLYLWQAVGLSLSCNDNLT